MARVPGLTRRGGVWQFRVRVPDKLRPEIGKREIVQSLGRVSFTEAARLARIKRADADRLFAETEARLRAEPIENLSPSQLHHLARAFLFRLEKNADHIPDDPDEREALADAVRQELSAISQSVEDASLQLVAKEFAAWAKLR